MRILVTGLACSGKSTYAHIIAEEINIDVDHLDLLIWKPNWQKTNNKDYFESLKKLLQRSDWIIEGFSPQFMKQQVEAAEIVVFMYASHLRITLNWLKRLWKYRSTNRPDMPVGNQEHFTVSYLKWLWKYSSKDLLSEVTKLAADKEVFIIRTRADRLLLIKQLLG